MKKALITGITGQDGSYLAELLIEKGYEVHGIKRRSSSFNTDRIDHIYEDPNKEKKKLFLHYGDLTDTSIIHSLLSEIQPDEVYNLGAQSHVAVSFENPEYTANVDAIGSLRILEGIRLLGLEKKCKFYQASSSELFGLVQSIPQNEKTPFYPRSPYAVAKLYAYWITVNYRESYDIFACNGILFNHESKRRGETFVTRKVTIGLCEVCCGLRDRIYLGNLEALRDWGHAKDYVKMQWLMLQQESPKDYVISTGKQISVRKFVEKTSKYLGFEIEWQGASENEVGIISKIYDKKNVNLELGKVVIAIDPKYFRPSEVNTLLGDSKKAETELGWKPEVGVDDMIKEMVDNDLVKAKKLKLLKDNGF